MILVLSLTHLVLIIVYFKFEQQEIISGQLFIAVIAEKALKRES